MKKYKNIKRKYSNAELAALLGLVMLILVGFALALQIETPAVWQFFGTSLVALFGYLLIVHQKK